MKKRIFWCFQQLEHIGGTEMVTLQIINMLKDEYDIHIVPFAKTDPSKIVYKLPENVTIEDISFPNEISQFDVNLKSKLQNKKFLKAIGFTFKTLYTYSLGRFKYRKKLSSISSKEDIIIIASSEIMLFAPRDRFVIQHFHFNSNLYFNFYSRLFRLLSKKPDYYIFLTDATKKAIDKTNKMPSSTILNPCRFPREEHYEYHNNTLMTAARLEAQKDPHFMLEIAKELSNRNFHFTYNIYGTGTFKKEMENYIRKHNLTNVHIIESEKNLAPFYASSDLYLMTSKFEGLPLTTIEATSLSLPIIWVDIKDPTSSFMIENENGFIVKNRDPKEFASKIIETLESKENLMNLKKRTYITSERFTEEKLKQERIATLNKLFDDLANK